MTHMKHILVLMSALSFMGCSPEQNAAESDLSIVGGKVVGAKEHAALSTVALMTPQGQAFCTGSLISPTIVVTAGHCVEGYEGRMLISFGVQAHLDKRMISATKRWVKRIQQHPNYKDDFEEDPRRLRGMNDIALLQLRREAPKPFRYIPMVPMNFKVNRGERLILAGFGVTQFQGENPGDRLRKVSTVLTGVFPRAREFDFGPTFGKTSCNGDSGGPAFVVRRSKKSGQNSLRLVGVTSRGNFCQDSGVYTDVRFFNPWMKKVVNAWRSMDRAQAMRR